MAKKKTPKKSAGKVSSGKAKAKGKRQKAIQPKQRQIKFPKEKKSVSYKKESGSTRKPARSVSKSSRSKSSAPKPARSYTPSKKVAKSTGQTYRRTYLFKEFKKKFGKTADKKYWKKIEKYWQTEYDKKGRPNTVVKAGITKKFVRTLKNRFTQTNKPYMGKTKWRFDKKTQTWKEGKPVKRYFWKDKLIGDFLRGRRVGARMKKVMEPDLIRGFMRKHGLKNYHKARKRFLKETANQSMKTVAWLYGAS